MKNIEIHRMSHNCCLIKERWGAPQTFIFLNALIHGLLSDKSSNSSFIQMLLYETCDLMPQAECHM